MAWGKDTNQKQLLEESVPNLRISKNLKQTKAVQKRAKEKQQQEKNARLTGKIQKNKKKRK